MLGEVQEHDTVLHLPIQEVTLEKPRRDAQWVPSKADVGGHPTSRCCRRTNRG
jgi:hypothetical protein